MNEFILNNNAFGFLLTDVSRLFRQAFEKSIMEAGLDLTPGEVRALAHVARAPNSRQTAIAERMGVEPMTLSAYLDRLETRELIHREVDPTDRRAKIVTLTDKAVDVFERIRPLATAVYEQTTTGLDEETCKMMLSALATMRLNLSSDPVLRQPWAGESHAAIPQAEAN
ncbi:MarR family winged helix-turn-helix transcriptional regulator [Consotaella aegiceratis]|uniref:MarR family winged helix-turn-helix transcriptional regulator n=1 Tax=Consotaella aegiceratis TaxID=3097961 RepID=UPI002F42D39D